MTIVKIDEALRVGWQNFTARPWYLLGLSLAVFVLFAFSIGNAVVTALAYILLAGYLTVFLKHFHGEWFVFDDLFSMDQRWIFFAFLGLIKGLLILAGLIFFIVPGVYLAIRWMFAELCVIDQGMRPIEALRESSRLTDGHKWKLLLFAAVVLLLLVLGVFVFIIGALVVSIVVSFAAIKIYYDLKSALEEAHNNENI